MPGPSSSKGIAPSRDRSHGASRANARGVRAASTTLEQNMRRVQRSVAYAVAHAVSV